MRTSKMGLEGFHELENEKWIACQRVAEVLFGIKDLN
jgi:hypothetical protein